MSDPVSKKPAPFGDEGFRCFFYTGENISMETHGPIPYVLRGFTGCMFGQAYAVTGNGGLRQVDEKGIYGVYSMNVEDRKTAPCYFRMALKTRKEVLSGQASIFV